MPERRATVADLRVLIIDQEGWLLRHDLKSGDLREEALKAPSLRHKAIDSAESPVLSAQIPEKHIESPGVGYRTYAEIRNYCLPEVT